MRSRPNVWIFVSAIIILSSCVAKKKFLAMETGRLNAEQEVRKLTAENNDKAERISVLISDFEDLKSELLESNAVKDQYIESLNKEISELSTNMSRSNETLEEKDYAFEFEKRRLNNAISERDAKISLLENQVESWKSTAYSRSSEIDKKNFDINREKEKVSLLEGEKKVLNGKIEKMQSTLDTIQNEISVLKKEIADKDTEILKLTNNVKLLKSQIGQ